MSSERLSSSSLSSSGSSSCSSSSSFSLSSSSHTSSPKDLRYPYWFIEASTTSNGDTFWKPIWKRDSAALEREFEARTGATVYVENRRAKVNLTEYIWSSCCDDRPDRRVTRGTWFYYNSSYKKYQPFPGPVADQIETWFVRLKDLAEGKSSFQAELDVTVHFTHTPGDYRIVATKVSAAGDCKPVSEGVVEGFAITMKSQAVTDIFNGAITLQRGIEVLDADEVRWSEYEVNNVHFVVHGIGQKFFAGTEKDFPHSVKNLRTLMLSQHELISNEEAAAARAGASTDTNKSNHERISSPLNEKTGSITHKDSRGKASADSDQDRNSADTLEGREQNIPTAASKDHMEVIGIEWYDLLRSDELTLSGDLKRVTLPNLQVVRQIANEVVLDVLLYLTPTFRRRILSYVCQKINKQYRKFCKYNPSFESSGGKASLIGHSLGTVILFDLLSMQTSPGQTDTLPEDLKLSFAPHAYFALGSPLGMFLSIRNSAHQADVNSIPIPLSLSRASSDADLTGSSSTVLTPGAGDDDTTARGESGDGGHDQEGMPGKRGDPESEGDQGELLSDIPIITELHKQFRFPTCSSFFNIFHPHDPVAYRIEPLLDPDLFERAPALVQHHDRGLGTVLKLKNIANHVSDTFSTVINSPLAGKVSSSADSTDMAANTITRNGEYNGTAVESKGSCEDDPSGDGDGGDRLSRKLKKEQCPEEIPEIPLNDGRRVDFMLQENFIQGANEYLSSITSHTSYFEMKDVARFIVLVSTS